MVPSIIIISDLIDEQLKLANIRTEYLIETRYEFTIIMCSDFAMIIYSEALKGSKLNYYPLK